MSTMFRSLIRLLNQRSMSNIFKPVYMHCNAYIFNRCKRFIFGPRREKTCLWGIANNTGADQPSHPRSLISAFISCFLESNICKLATG